MIFSSIEFVIFFILFICLIKIFKNNQKEIIIVLSLFFYAYWNPIFIFLILYLCSATYCLIKKRIKLKLSIFIILLPLFYFKYSFFIFSFIPLKILNNFSYIGELPLAISFITFTAVAILIDIKNKTFNETLTFVNFSEFILYFPQLIAGPILRAKELIPQLKNKIFFKKENIKFGIFLFSIGFVKKIFFADNIALLIDPIFENPELFGSKDLIKGFLLFPLQIYFDFSGYVDMALGISAFIGIKLPINFDKPYLTYSLTDFWRSWHITLSNWFRDYLYIPLGGSRVSKLRLYFNLIFTMTVAGLWHGASFNFILWGFFNGLFLSLEKIFNINNNRNILKIILNCFIIFNLWLIFRITDVKNLINYFYKIYSNLSEIFITENLLIFVVTCFAIYCQKFENLNLIKKFSVKLNFFILMPFFIILLITGFAISTGQSDKFIYFDF
jgi:alginate O-acetyltransferase complex protein AlgI